MTNEEKAKQLAHFVLYDNSYESMDRNTYDKCMEMAKWKDKQAKEQRRIIRKHWQNWATEQIKKILIVVYSVKSIKNIKGYVNEKYKSITGKYIKLPKCMGVEEYHESAQMKLKDAQIGELKKALIDKACEWLKSQYPTHYMEWAEIAEKVVVDFRKAMEDEK